MKTANSVNKEWLEIPFPQRQKIYNELYDSTYWVDVNLMHWTCGIKGNLLKYNIPECAWTYDGKKTIGNPADLLKFIRENG